MVSEDALPILPHNMNRLSIIKNTVAVTYTDEGALYA